MIHRTLFCDLKGHPGDASTVDDPKSADCATDDFGDARKPAGSPQVAADAVPMLEEQSNDIIFNHYPNRDGEKELIPPCDNVSDGNVDEESAI